MEHNLYCISNASTDVYKNTLTSFKNLFPRSVDLKHKNWEIGLVSVGMHLNYDMLTISNNEPVVMILENDVEPSYYNNIGSQTGVMEKIKSVWYLPCCREKSYTLQDLADALFSFLDKENFTFSSIFSSKEENKVIYSIWPKSEELLSNDLKKYLEGGENFYGGILMHPKIVNVFRFQCHKLNGELCNENKDVLFLGKKYIFFLLRRNTMIKSLQNSPNKLLNPGLVQIYSNVISDVPSGNDYSTIMHSTCLPYNAEGQYYYHHVNNVRYYPIRQTNIESISVKLKDIFGNKLPIKEGQPTVAHFHLREKDDNMDHSIYHIRIDSKTDAKLDFENSNNSFWVHLKHPLQLNHGATLALSDISFPNSICNVIENKGGNVITFTNTQRKPDGMLRQAELKIPEFACYNDKSIIIKLNEIVPKDFKEQILFDIIDGYFTIIRFMPEVIVLTIPNYLVQILGLIYNFPEETPSDILLRDNGDISIGLKSNKFVAPKKMDVYKYYPGSMICYANFVQHSIVGDKFYPIFKIIPTLGTNKESDYTSIHFEHLEYVKCNVNYLDNMKFELRTLDGDLIKFGNDRRIVLNIVIKNPK